MCGILGVVSLGERPIDLQALQRMNDLQSHRGPDGEGFMLRRPDSGISECAFIRRVDASRENANVQVALGHRRLAIIDLAERSLQPMASADAKSWIVFNGEIYNFKTIRDELRRHGFTFSTDSDTEVLLQAYRHWGADCLSHLEGMYAFAIWDDARRTLFCARDRFGIKPFYYTVSNDFFVFASEIKALLAFPGVEAVADDDAVFSFLAHGNCDYGARTMFRGIHALPASQSLTLEIGTPDLALRTYYQLKPAARDSLSDADRVGQLQEALTATVRKHLISDVRAGSCLSGGLDSSVVVSLIGEICRDQPEAATAVGTALETFTSCYDYPELDEREYALAVSRAAGARTNLVFPSAADFWSDFERMAWHQDMPFGSLSFYAQWRVMRAAKEAGVKVLLDGQGGDEVFGGYAKFRYAYLASLLRAGQIPTLVGEVGAMIRQGDRYVLDLRKGFRYLPKGVRSLLNVDSALKDVLKADWRQIMADRSTPAARWWQNASRARDDGDEEAGSIMQRIQIDDILIDTLPQLLRFEDRSSMAFSIEARVPLLDHRLVESGISLPDNLKVKGGWSKFAVREAMRGRMPEEVRMRKSKLGFAAPDRIWMSHDLRPQITEMIGSDMRCQKYIDPKALRTWYDSTRTTKPNTESYLGMFRVMALETWMRAFHVS